MVFNRLGMGGGKQAKGMRDGETGLIWLCVVENYSP